MYIIQNFGNPKIIFNKLKLFNKCPIMESSNRTKTQNKSDFIATFFGPYARNMKIDVKSRLKIELSFDEVSKKVFIIQNNALIIRIDVEIFHFPGNKNVKIRGFFC